MRPNLIQTYVNNLPPVNHDKKDRNLDIEYVLSNRTFIKPLKSRGHLVNTSILETPAETAKDFVYDMKSLHKSVNGTANDHELGKINDIGMKLGGLAIAAYLMTRKQTPLTKAMELVGLASFFGAMSIWPKLALQLPARLIHGFNIRQQYEDSFGRKKMLFQDPQYIPWDMVSDKRINKIGDWMRVPKYIPNRRDFIQEKMKKTAVQNNTMWMLTAGFATPITSALICNACEKPLKKYLNNMRSKNADKLIANISKEFPKYKDTSVIKELDNLYQLNKGKSFTPKLIKQINEIMIKDFDGVTAGAIIEDLNQIILQSAHSSSSKAGQNIGKSSEPAYIINENTVKKVVNNLNEALDKVLTKSQISAIIPDDKTLTSLLKAKNYFSSELPEKEVKKLLQTIGLAIKENIRDYNLKNANEIINEVFVLNKLINRPTADGPVTSALHSNSAAIFNSSVLAKLKNTANILTDFKAKNAVLDKYVYLKAAAAPETVVANAWNEVTSSLPKLFNISSEDINNMRFDRKIAGKVLREKLEHITSNEGEYNKVLTSLVDKISQLDAKIKMLDTSSSSKESYVSVVDSVFDETAGILKNNKVNMPHTAERLVGNKGSLKNVQLSYVSNRLLGVRSSLYRLLNTLDFYKRISTLENIPALHNGMPREIKEELVELCKKMSIEGTTSDFITKFYELRNPQPNIEDKSQIKVLAGKVENLYLGKAVNGGRVDLPNDRAFFQEAIKLLFENEMHPKTTELLSNSVFAGEVAEYRKAFAKDIGDAFYFVKPKHIVHDIKSDASSYKQFLRMGMSPDQMLSVTVKEAFNTKKWLKIFGGFGAGLLGVTVLAQFLFGKMKINKGVNNDKLN